MNILTTLIFAILQMMGGKHTKNCIHTLQAKEIALEIILAVEAEHKEISYMSRIKKKVKHWKVNPFIVAAVMKRESSFIKDIEVGEHGEIGWMQIKPDGMAKHVCEDLLDRLNDPSSNLLCGVRILSYANSLCDSANPMNWLGIYNGIKKCGPTNFAKKVLSELTVSIAGG